MKHILGPNSKSTLTNVREGDCQPNAVDLRLDKVFRILPNTFEITNESIVEMIKAKSIKLLIIKLPSFLGEERVSPESCREVRCHKNLTPGLRTGLSPLPKGEGLKQPHFLDNSLSFRRGAGVRSMPRQITYLLLRKCTIINANVVK